MATVRQIERPILRFPLVAFFEITGFIAIAFAAYSAPVFGPWLVLLLLHVLMFTGPIAIAFVAIITAQAEGNRLTITGNKPVALATRIWIYCIATVILHWLLVAVPR